jgi:Predicted permease
MHEEHAHGAAPQEAGEPSHERACQRHAQAEGERQPGHHPEREGTADEAEVAAFIFASPLLSPITVALTWAMLGWEMTLARTIAAIAGALLLGAALHRLEARLAPGPRALLMPIAGGSPECDPACCSEPGGGAGHARHFATSMRRILRTILPYFALGMAIAAAIIALLPEQAFPGALGGSSVLAVYLLAAIVAIPIYVCEGEEVPITYALVGHGLGQGPALTFLLGSVGTCVPTMLMSQSLIGRGRPPSTARSGSRSPLAQARSSRRCDLLTCSGVSNHPPRPVRCRDRVPQPVCRVRR